MKTEQGNEQVKLPDWSKEDLDWLKKHIKEPLWQVALRYERPLFQMVMHAGQVEFCFQTLSVNTKHPQLQAMLQNILKSWNDLMATDLKTKGYTEQLFIACKQDIERMGALLDHGQVKPGDTISKGGIVIAH